MGIVHFATLGASPGAVTSALAYLKRHYDEYRSDYSGELIESMVLFCSPEIAKGERLADDFTWNSYGMRGARQGWIKPRGGQNAVEVIQDFITDARHGALLEGGSLYVWQVDVNDYNACFDAVAMATLALARGDDTGKYIWAHLTGGTNVLNAALVHTASLSGLIGRLFYAFIARREDSKFLNPPTESRIEYRLDEITTFKMSFDAAYYLVLEKIGNGRDNVRDLLDSLKNDALVYDRFAKTDSDTLINGYLNRMDGREIRFERTENRLMLSDYGKKILGLIEQPLFKALVNRSSRVPPELLDHYRKELNDRRWSLPL